MTGKYNTLQGGRDLGMYSGARIDVVTPDPRSIRIIDLLLGMARQARLAGQATQHVSVLAHSVAVAIEVEETLGVDHPTTPRAVALALLHDASEALLCDLPTPVKRLPELSGYRQVEERMQRAVMHRFGLEMGSEQALIKAADLKIMEREGRAFQPSQPWGGPPQPLPYPHPYSSLAHESQAWCRMMIQAQIAMGWPQPPGLLAELAEAQEEASMLGSPRYQPWTELLDTGEYLLAATCGEAGLELWVDTGEEWIRAGSGNPLQDALSISRGPEACHQLIRDAINR